MTIAECLACAAEAEEIARLVSFNPDRERLRRDAAAWRALAAAGGELAWRPAPASQPSPFGAPAGAERP